MTRNFAIYACPTAKNTTTESYTTKLLYKEKLSQQNAVHVGFAFLGVFFHSRESGMRKRYSRAPGNNEVHGATPVLPNSATGNACGMP